MQFGTIRYRHDIWPPSWISKLPYTRFWQNNPVNLHPNLARTHHTFAKDVLSLLASCEDMGNPFIEDSGDMLKSDLMECITKSSQPASIHRVIDANVLDGAAIVHMVRPGVCRTFEE